MVTRQCSHSLIGIFLFISLVMMTSFSTAAQAELGGDLFKNDGSAARGIQALCAQAAAGIARQPEAEGVILEGVRGGLAKIMEQHKKLRGGSRGVPEAIGVIGGAAIEGIARQPEAAEKILNLVEECEAELDKLGNAYSRFGFKGQGN